MSQRVPARRSLSQVKAAGAHLGQSEGVTTTDTTTVTLDVRAEFRAGRRPMALILETVVGLKAHEDLRLIAPFQPLPLFEMMARRGFVHSSRLMESGDWEVLFTRPSATRLAPATSPAGSATTAGRRAASPPRAASSSDGLDRLEVDARGLEPPQPLVLILEALAALPAGAAMRAHTDRRPMHLYAQLEARGYLGETEEQHDGSFITTIRPA